MTELNATCKNSYISFTEDIGDLYLYAKHSLKIVSHSFILTIVF